MTSQNTDQLFLLSFTGSGNIEFLFKTSSGPGMVVIPPPPGDSFCNGKRHMLSLRRYLDEFRYRVNRRRSVTKRIGLPREPFSRPFRVYVGTTLQGCVSGIDIIFYRTQYKTYSVGVSKGCANVPVKTTKTTPTPPDTTASTPRFTSQSVRTRISKESVIQTTPTSSMLSIQASSTKDVSPTTGISQENTLVTQSVHVTHSLPTTLPDSTSVPGYTSQGVHAQSSKEVTQPPSTRVKTPSVMQSDNILDPFYIGEDEITLPSHSNLVTSPTTSSTSGPRVSTSKYVQHSSSKLDFVTITTARDMEDATISATRNSIFRSTGKKLLQYVKHSPSTTDSAPVTRKHKSEGTNSSVSSNSKFQTATRKLSKHEKCEYLRSKFCAYMGYDQTRLPGEEGFTNQLQAEKQMRGFLPFIRANCSRFLRDFICVSHLPPCSSPQSPAVQPCRELCLRSKQECASLMKAFEFDWPEYLDCRKFPSSENGKCIKAHGDTGVPVVPTPATHHNRNPGCGGILTRSSGIIKTPHFPNPYPANTLCKWHIILPKIYHVVDIILEEVSLEADVNCGYDYLLFLDGLSNQVGPRICGFLAYPRVITVKGNIVSIIFRSDSALNKKGVLIKYTAHSYL